jgi:hypothetical protein
MKFPSIKNLTDSALTTLQRFPFEVLFALAGTIAATIFINSDDNFSNSFYTKIVMTANLGLLLSLATTLFFESKGAKKQRATRFVAALLAACLIFIFNRQLRTIDSVRFFLLSLALHLLVAFAAFTSKDHIQGFWQFNKTLFLRFLAGVLYSSVLYAGLAAAIGASNFLFNLHIEGKTYGILFAWIAGVFNTIFFLAGVPADIAALDNDITYPKGLKVFTQYVLIPLASVYVVILLAYEVKILIQWSLPKGLVSNLILGYAVFGILSILLIYPLRDQEETKWIKTYSRSFYFLLIPLLILLFLAVFTRIIPYGITAPRYFLIVLACWLLLITFYFLLSRRQNIKIIPVSLCILTLLSVYGPQSAFSVAKYSQRGILTGIFKKHNAFKNGKLIAVNKIKVDKKDGERAIEKLRYFVYDNDLSGLQPCIDKDINKAIDSISKLRDTTSAYVKNHPVYINEYELKNKEMEWVTNYLGLSRFMNNNTGDNSINYSFEVINSHLVIIKGYDYALSFNSSLNTDTASLNLKTDNITIKQTADISQVYTLYLNKEKVSFNLKNIADSLVKNENIFNPYASQYYESNYKSFLVPNQLLGFTKQTKHFKVTFQIDNIRYNYTDSNNIEIDGINGSYLISVLK